MISQLFPKRPSASPKIYVYSTDAPETEGYLKVGYTTRDVRKRISEQTQTAQIKPHILLEEDAIRNDGSTFTDKAVHRVLGKRFSQLGNSEWFQCSLADVSQAIEAVRNRSDSVSARILDFEMRPEQREAVEKTQAYFNNYKTEDANRAPKFLWNAKMRFGKTFTTYELAKAQGYNRVLVLTFKPAVENAWREDLETHKDFAGWQFISRETELSYDAADTNRPIVCFGSFQDYLGKNEAGGIKPQNEWVHTTNWDLVVFDEYHFGAWRDTAKELFESDESETRVQSLDQVAKIASEALLENDEDFLPITAGAYLYLSGTPFRALGTGEFIEDQIFSWTYSDEQREKQNWGDKPNNPYAALPRMVLMTYQLPDTIDEVAAQGEFDEFDLNEFFAAEGNEELAEFKHKSDVQKWLDLIRGSYATATTDNLKLGAEKPPLPYADSRLATALMHSFWYLPTVASCYAMRNLLNERNNIFYNDYKIIVCAGPRAGIGLDALTPVMQAMANPLESKTITLSCGKLTTGVTVKPWTAIFMLRNLKSPETYFQAAFRVQSPWVIDNPDGLHPTEQEVLKKECYVFDFAPIRALRQISEYSNELNSDSTSSPEKNVADFISFLPVLAYDGSSMREVSATDILDYAMSGTTSTMLARRWESALLVNVDDGTLRRILDDPQALKVLQKIEGFRSLNDNILETIINKSEHIKDVKKNHGDNLTSTEKKELSAEEKEYKGLRTQVREKLIKFATRIPIFMYLTDFREHTLNDVITKLDSALFERVTGLTVKDFQLLIKLNVFNSGRMNDSVYKFKRYEDDSLTYTGINRHKGEAVGGYDTVITQQEFEELN